MSRLRLAEIQARNPVTGRENQKQDSCVRKHQVNL